MVCTLDLCQFWANIPQSVHGLKHAQEACPDTCARSGKLSRPLAALAQMLACDELFQEEKFAKPEGTEVDRVSWQRWKPS